MLETPSTVLTPKRSFTMRTAFRVSRTASCWALAVRVRQSIYTSSRGMPAASAAATIFCASANRCSASAGIPFSSSVRPTTAAPYFLQMGRRRSSTACSPFTELTIGLPLYTRSPASRTSARVESSCRGRSHTLCTAFTARIIISCSSISGRPTFTSRISAPAPACSTAWERI